MAYGGGIEIMPAPWTVIHQLLEVKGAGLMDGHPSAL